MCINMYEQPRPVQQAIQMNQQNEAVINQQQQGFLNVQQPQAPIQQGVRRAGTERVMDEEQTGSNCGCFAFGIAVWNRLSARQKARLMDHMRAHAGAENAVEHIALRLQEYAVDHNFSSFGEMFSADALAASINGIANDLGIHVTATVEGFEDETRFLQIVGGDADAVLVPFYAGDEYSSGPTEGDPVTSSTMINAHWGLVNNEDRNLRVYEGNRTAKSQYYDSRTIVNSNLQLIDTVDMGLYFNGRNSAELTAFRNRAAHLGENNDTIIMLNDAANRDVNSEALNDRVREDAFQEGEMTERVDLRGKVITLRFG